MKNDFAAYVVLALLNSTTINEIHRTAKDQFQLVAHLHQRTQTVASFWSEIDQHINVARLREILTQHRAEECHFANIPALAESPDRILRQMNLRQLIVHDAPAPDLVR